MVGFIKSKLLWITQDVGRVQLPGADIGRSRVVVILGALGASDASSNLACGIGKGNLAISQTGEFNAARLWH